MLSKLHICVLQSSYENSDSPFKKFDSYCNPGYFSPDHNWESVLVNKATSYQQIQELSKKNFDVFINLCDGAPDEDRAGVEVIQALEHFNVPYTGADQKFYEPTKEMMKMVAHRVGVDTPAFVFAYNEKDISEAAETLTFPLIVKHYNGYGSIGMTKDSRVEYPEQLFIQARKIITEYGGALIEEFIEGQEFTVLVAENSKDPDNPSSFQPIECKFGNGHTFKSFDLKWLEYESIKWIPSKNVELNHRMQEVSKKVFAGMKGAGYGRTDLRVNKEGRVFFLEMNSNCGLFYPSTDPDYAASADFILLNDPMGHSGFIDLIINAAIERNKKKKKSYEFRFHKKMGYGMHSTKDIREGEIIEQNEETSHYLVSKSKVENWTNPVKKEWFSKYSYPITDETWVMWNPDPNSWHPLNHSCDPNAWFDPNGLTMTARRDITNGEQITVDYATFMVENMKEFTCYCGSDKCRGQIKGTDYLEPWVSDRYRTHLSQYVASKRKVKGI